MLATNELLSVNNLFYHTVVFVTMQKLSAFLIHLQDWAELKIAKICSGNYIHPARNCLLTDTNMKVSPPDDGNSEKFWNEVWSRLSMILQPSYCHKDFSSKNYAIFFWDLTCVWHCQNKKQAWNRNTHM